MVPLLLSCGPLVLKPGSHTNDNYRNVRTAITQLIRGRLNMKTNSNRKSFIYKLCLESTCRVDLCINMKRRVKYEVIGIYSGVRDAVHFCIKTIFLLLF